MEKKAKKEEKIEELRKEEHKIREQRVELENELEGEIQIPHLKKMKGKHFVYRNNGYGGDTPKWNVYRKVVDYVHKKSGSFHFIYEEYQQDCYGVCKIEVAEHFAYTNKEWWGCNSPFSGFIPCSVKEYNLAKSRILKEMKTQTKIRKDLLKN